MRWQTQRDCSCAARELNARETRHRVRARCRPEVFVPSHVFLSGPASSKGGVRISRHRIRRLHTARFRKLHWVFSPGAFHINGELIFIECTLYIKKESSVDMTTDDNLRRINPFRITDQRRTIHTPPPTTAMSPTRIDRGCKIFGILLLQRPPALPRTAVHASGLNCRV